MYGLDWNDPLRIRSWQELVNWINEIGYLPLFRNEIEGFSAEEHTANVCWWTEDPEQDPWIWREIIAKSRKVAYGKFFGKNDEKNFAGIITDLQMQTYLVVKDFRRKVNKRGGECGMPVCIYSKPEDVWGYDMVTASYHEDQSASWEQIWNQVRKLYPVATEEQLLKVLR